MDHPTPFTQLLQAARAQPQPQRLLFVFAAAELPDDASAAQRAEFERGQGGTLTPLMCVDKGLDELSSFDALVNESRQAGPPWQVAFAAALSGQHGAAPTAGQVEAALNTLVERVRLGQFGGLLALAPDGAAVHFAAAAAA
jgi:hypothetical protein